MNKDYFDDVKVRADLARQAQKKKCHGKRPKVASDFMSKKEILAQNGAVVSMNPNKPMNHSQYKMLPDNLRREYLHHLKDTYNPTLRMLADMFGKSNSWVVTERNRLGVAGKGTTSPATKKEMAAWNAFLGVADQEEEAATPAQEPAAEPEPVNKPAEEEKLPKIRNTSTLEMLDFKINGNVAEFLHRVFEMAPMFGLGRYVFQISAYPVKDGDNDA